MVKQPVIGLPDIVQSSWKLVLWRQPVIDREYRALDVISSIVKVVLMDLRFKPNVATAMDVNDH